MPLSQKQTARGILVCLLVVSAWFSPWWAGGRNLAPLDLLNQMMAPWRGTGGPVAVKNHAVADAVDQYLVYRLAAESAFRTEGWLGWSSLTYGGTAQYANTMALYYDWTMQLHRWFGFWTAWHLGLMAQVMLAAVGMLLLLRGRSIGILWACCGALAYAANSQFIVWVYHRWTLGAFCWVPWILWAADSWKNGRRGFWMFVPVFTALALLGGTLQHCAFVMLVLMAAWLEESLAHRKNHKALACLSCKYVVWAILGTGMAGMMILPCADAFFTSSRLGLHTGLTTNAAQGIYPQGKLQPLFNLAAYPFQIFPSILGRCDTMDLLKAFKSELFYVAYFGSLPVLISYLALCRKQTLPLARILIGAGLILPLTPLVRYLYQRLFLLSIIGGVLAFCHFMENADREIRLRISKIVGALTMAAILGWTALSVIFKINAAAILSFLEGKYLDASSGSAFGYFRNWMQGRFASFTSDLCIWSPQQLFPLILFLAALTGLKLTASLNPRRRAAGSWLVALAVVMEVTLFASRWIVFTNPAQCPLYPVTPEVTALQHHVGHGRVTTLNKENTGHMAVTPFVPNTLSPYGIATIQGYDSIVPNGMAVGIRNPQDSLELGRLAVTHLITYPGNSPEGAGWVQIWDSPSMVLFENLNAIPRYIGFGSSDGKDAFFNDQRDGSWQPLVETEGRENTRTIKVPRGVQWIRIAENQASGWEYCVGEHPASLWKPVLRAKDATMILPLDGRTDHPAETVRMRYNPPLRATGFLVSSIAAGITLACGLLAFRFRIGFQPFCSSVA